MASISRNKNGYKSTPWNEDYNLMSWTSLSLFDEYLEMGKFILWSKSILQKFGFNKI